ncbi:GNAT family N-acetyltransferase [Photobacterium rosenbergii]|uniref:GNAT family N-acetyltransferase n=1 Tax=Photobacterium rosenbergii TaxID=294936 RepID=UPI001C9A25BA|nr:GNAT family N-acetyltransferase [Photobacterium rosenbergii]MBY5947743.1 GNAT family N-acetyltransferase [Photobacterium rosenbergii]
MQDKRVRDVYRSYFQFNNERTLSTDLASELFTAEAEGCSVFVDKTRKYDNQVIIYGVCSTENLESHLELFNHGFSPEISIEPQANTKELKKWLSNREFTPVYEHEFLELRTLNYVSTKAAPEQVSVECWEHNNVDEFLALLKTSGLECTGEVWEKKRSLYCTDTFRCYVAKIDGKPCAWATSFIEKEYAILANAYTQESYRSMGCQTALLRVRIEDAISLGIKVILTDVMPSSTSSKNCKSVGFSSVGIRSVWCKG